MADYIIIARSGRALAASAKRAGHNVHVIDYFADEDTKSISSSAHQLQYDCDGFDKEKLLKQIKEIYALNPHVSVVVGSGFETHPEFLDQLREIAPVFANSNKTIARLKEPICFFKTLSNAAIKHPQISLEVPIEPDSWLIKKSTGIGGGHVNWLNQVDNTTSLDCYYQKYIPGIVSSVVFIANGCEASIIGFNQQLQTVKFPDMPFLYQGAVSLHDVSEKHKTILIDIVNVITKDSKLKGLCGLDYIVDENDDVNVLEVNPRPPSTFELHETDQSLFDIHLACFNDHLSVCKKYNETERKQELRGSAILYAKENMLISDKVSWPEWVKDIPSTGYIVPAKYPVCTVHARENSIDKIKTILFNRLDKIESIIVAMQNAA
jgi:uncharacterized protein